MFVPMQTKVLFSDKGQCFVCAFLSCVVTLMPALEAVSLNALLFIGTRYFYPKLSFDINPNNFQQVCCTGAFRCVLTGSFRLALEELGEQELLGKEKDVWKVLRSYSFPNSFENVVFKSEMGEHMYFVWRRNSIMGFFPVF